MNIHQLNESLRDSKILCNFENGEFNIGRSFKLDKHIGLSAEQSEAAQRIFDRLDEFILDDFEYELSLDGDKPRFSLNYDDGLNGGYFGGIDFDSEEGLFSRLLAYDWDEQRGVAIRGVDLFDEMLEESKTRKVDIPSVKYLRKNCRAEVKAYHKAARTEKPKFSYLVLEEREEQGGFDLMSYDDPEDEEGLMFALSDAMMARRLIASVCIDGKPLPSGVIETMKKQILELLPPISRAKAEGRYC